MKEALKYLEILEIFDIWQQGKVLYKLSEIIGISFFAMVAYANDCVENVKPCILRTS